MLVVLAVTTRVVGGSCVFYEDTLASCCEL